MPGHEKRPELLVLSSVPFHRGYGSLRHLIRALHSRGVRTRCFAPIPAGQMGELGRFPVPVESYFSRWYGGIPKVRSLLFRLDTVLPALATADAVLCAHLGFFPECVLAKHLRPSLQLIHYCPELWTREEYGESFALRFYDRYGGMPDLVIDTNTQRAKERQRMLHLKTTPLVLPNTLPFADLPRSTTDLDLGHTAGLDERTRPWLIYAGNLSWVRRIDILLGAMKLARTPFALVVIANAQADLVTWAKNEVERHGLTDRIRLLPGRPWAQTMAMMSQADAGLMYYPEVVEPTLNIRFCSPTKVYEYLALGLPVVSTGNPTMRDLLTQDGLGACAQDDTPEALAIATDTVFDRDKMRSRKEIASRFRERLSFEAVSEPILEAIERSVSSTQS